MEHWDTYNPKQAAKYLGIREAALRLWRIRQSARTHERKDAEDAEDEHKRAAQ